MRRSTTTPMECAPSRRAGAADVAIGNRIRAQRTTCKLTQEELAALLGISSQQLQKYESGENRVSAARAVDIARRLGIEVGDLLTEPMPEHPAQPNAAVPSPQDIIDLIVSRCNEVASGGRVIDAILTNTMLPELSIALLERQMAGEEVTTIDVTVVEGAFAYVFNGETAAPAKKAKGKAKADATA